MQFYYIINAENIQSINDFENTTLFKDFSGEALLDIAINVKTTIHTFIFTFLQQQKWQWGLLLRSV